MQVQAYGVYAADPDLEALQISAMCHDPGGSAGDAASVGQMYSI